MERILSGHAVRALLMLLTVAALLAPILALRAAPPVDVTTGGLAWIIPALSAGLIGAAGMAAVASLAVGLRHGSLASVLLAGSSAALVGGALALIAGSASIAVAVAVAATLTLAAAVAGRAAVLIAGHRARVVAAGLVLVMAEVAVALDILPVLAEAIDPFRSPLLLAAAVLSGLAALVAATRDLGPAAAALAVGALALAVARGAGAELVLGLVTLTAAALLTTRSVIQVAQKPAATDDDRLPEVVAQLSEGVLRFDGHLRLRAWNPAAAAMLGLDAAGEGTRLEDLLGLALPQLPAGSETVLHHTPIGGLDLSIHRDATSITVVVREPPVSGNAERLGRELRATIEELLQARRTVELQRVEIERAATTDLLTGVASRAAILDRLRVEVAQARRYQHPVTILLLDLDRFGEINAAHGIEGGDTVLREIALRVRLRVRAADALGRSGSDGLLSILPHTDEGGAATFAETLRRRIGQRPISVGDVEITVTLSVGVAVMRPGEDLDLDGLVTRAEEALASARSAGGDRIALDRLHGLARLDMASTDPGEENLSEKA
ncbi:MAG: GGDEF domain-containing protein [Candidatus Limnocylindria bacterium]